MNLERTVKEVFPGSAICPYIMLGGADARKYEAIGENIYRFTPMYLSADDLKGIHGTNERLSQENLERAVLFYMRFIEKYCTS